MALDRHGHPADRPAAAGDLLRLQAAAAVGAHIIPQLPGDGAAAHDTQPDDRAAEDHGAHRNRLLARCAPLILIIISNVGFYRVCRVDRL